MSLQGHIEELKRKHEALDTELHDALMHPSVDDTAIISLKRRKLQIKDQLARLAPQATDGRRTDSIH